MNNVLSKTNTFDRSPLIFGRFNYARTRVLENVARYHEVRANQPGRIASDHLFISLLMNLNVPFGGDIEEYMSKVDAVTRRLVTAMGLVTPYSKGDLFNEGIVYPKCREIITCVRGNHTAMDIWKGWRDLSAVTVQVHPVTDITLFDPVVVNSASLSNPGMCVLNIDLPLMAAQYRMYTANGGRSLEQFVAQVVVPGIVKSHVDVCIFNKVALKLGVMNECTVKTNLNFAQNESNIPIDQVVDDVVKALLAKSLQPRQILATVPSVFRQSYLDHISDITMAPTNQALWALEASRFTAAGVCLELGKIQGFGKMVEMVTKIKRNLIQADQEGWYTNQLRPSESAYVMQELATKVVSRLPA